MIDGGDGLVVEQIVFRWSQRCLTGHKGVGPVATSLPPEELGTWDKRLRERVWAAAGDGENQAGLAFLTFGPHCAVVHKVPVADQPGRDGSTLAHALVGSHLDSSLALGLHNWVGWITTVHEVERVEAEGQLPTVRRSDLSRSASSGLKSLRESARAQPPRLVAELVTQVLADPAGSFSAVDSPARPAELICALLDVVGDSGTKPWTFSTREDADIGTDLPRMVFLAGTGGFSTQGTNRRRFRLGGMNADLQPFALALAELYSRAGEGAIRRLRPVAPPSTVAEVEFWAQQAQLAPGVLATVSDLLTRIGTGELSPAEEQVLADKTIGERLEPHVKRLSESELQVILAGWHENHTAWNRFPAVQNVVHKASLQRSMTGRSSIISPKLTGLSARAVMDQLLAVNTGPDDTVTIDRLLPLLQSARSSGVSVSDQMDLVTQATNSLYTHQLLSWIVQHAASMPDIAKIVLEALSQRVDGKRDRAESRQVFLSHQGFSAVIESIQPKDQRSGILLYDWLVRVVLGTDLNRVRVMREVLHRLGPHPSPALLYVLHKRADSSRAKRVVQEVAAQQYFRALD